MDTSFFLTIFLFAVQTAAGVAPMRWPQHKWLTTWIWYVSGLLAVGSLIWWILSNRDSLMSTIQPPHIIAIGLAVALAGLVWQWLRVPPQDPVIAQLQKQGSDLRQELLTSKVQSGTPNQPAVPKPVHYTERDIRELLDSLDEANNLLEKHILPTSIAIESATANWFSTIPNMGRKPFAEELKKMKASLRTEIWDPINALVYRASNRHVEEMRVAFVLDDEAAKGEMSRSLQVAIDALEKLPDDSSEPVRELIKPQFNEARRQSNLLWNWASGARNRVASMRSNLKTQGVTGFEK